MDKRAFDFSELAQNAARSVWSQIGDLKQIRERPFELLFKYITPGLLMLRGKWILAALFGVADDVLNIGPARIGAWLDKMIGKGPGSGNTDAVNETDLMSASKRVIDGITGALFTKSSAFRREVERRGVVDARAFVVAWAHGPDGTIEKNAASLSSKVRSWLAMSPYKSGGFFSGMLFSFLKAFLVGLGIHSGLSMLFGGGGGEVAMRPSATPGAPGGSGTAASGMRLYVNAAGNVERSLIMALDGLIRDKEGRPFSVLFADLKGYPLEGSPEMDRVLGEVRAAHGGASIYEISGYKTFAAPPPAGIARILLPQATYTKQTAPPSAASKPDAERELEGILGGKQ